MTRPDLGVMVLAHKRHQLLALICRQIFKTWPDARIDFTLDRPEPAVADEVRRLAFHHDGVRIFNAQFAAIDGRENFIALRDWQLQKLHETGCRHIAMWDDDHILADPLEAKTAMDEGAHLVYATKLYFWDGLNSANVALPVHTSILFSRRIDGDHWTKMVGAPEQAAALESTGPAFVRTLENPLLDVGYMAESERQRVWKVYKRAGKIDQLTTGLILPPALHRVREALAQNNWYQELEVALRHKDAGDLRVAAEG